MKFISIKRHVRGAPADLSTLGIGARREGKNAVPCLEVIGNLPHGTAIHPDTPRDAARLVAWIMESFPLCNAALVKQERLKMRKERDSEPS